MKASLITLYDFSSEQKYGTMFRYLYTSSLTQCFTSSRPARADSYLQDLEDFMEIYYERVQWLNQNRIGREVHYMAFPAYDSTPSQFGLAVSFCSDADASKYKRAFQPK